MASDNASATLPLAPAEAGVGAESASKAFILPRELADFLTELSVAIHKHAIYPAGHPLLVHAVDSVHRALVNLLLDRPALSIGVARRQLIIEGVATDANHPLLTELAGKLHRHHLGAIKFLTGLERAELSEMLAAVGLEAQRDVQPIGLQPDQLQSRWRAVKLFPLTYDRLELLDADQSPQADSRHGAQLWLGLARAAIASDLAVRTSDDAFEPEAVAHAIDEHHREQAYDQVIVGYLLQIAHEVRTGGIGETSALQRRISQLVGSLQPETLQRLLEMGGDAVQRRRFVLDASQSMTVKAVVELIQAAASAEGQTISHSLVRMLTKLATHADSDPSARGRAADGAFREHVVRLVGSWSLDDPNPAAYSAALSQLAQVDAAPDDHDVPAQFACEPGRLVGMALEIGVDGDRVRHAIDTLLDQGAYGELLDLIDNAPERASTLASEIWARIRDRKPLAELIAAPRLDHAVIRRLVLRIGAEATAPILAALDVCGEGTRRERLLSYLLQIGPPAVRAIAVHLDSASPALARDLLVCLGKLAPAAPPPEVRLCREHADPTVRREAVKLLLSYPSTRESALLAAISDSDERVIYCGVVAAAQGCPADAAEVIQRRIDAGELTDATVCAAGIRAVASRHDDATLDWILRRTVVSSGLLRRTRLAPATPELLASLGALATYWPDDPRAAAAISLARESTSASLRAAVNAR